ncbi:MutS family DNA mismatch repair protein [Echinicola sediminis]
MTFEIDNQTVKDLELFSNRPNTKSIFSLFNCTKTFGGKLQLKGLMESPLDDASEILNRRDTIRFFMDFSLPLTIQSSQMDFIDHYFRLNKTTLKPNVIDAYFQKTFVRQSNRNDLYLIMMGVEKLGFLLTELTKLIEESPKSKVPEQLTAYFSLIEKYLQKKEIIALIKEIESSPQPIKHYKYDWVFRDKYKEETQELVNTVYVFDAFNAVAQTAKERGFCLPEIKDASIPEITIKGLFHPFLKSPTTNNIALPSGQNFCFLTGPNMAGKSTFLKSLGLAIYLAHLGFPVPAKAMSTSVYNGLITTINLPDDMGLGHSHFYSEVRRIKDVAMKIKEKSRVFVIFDELFRGTNVKDAHDASLYIIEAFSKIGKSTFFISTHITEIADKLRDWPNIKFQYFDAKLKGNELIYSYQLKQGVSHERLGMHILAKENIPDILKTINEGTK